MSLFDFRNRRRATLYDITDVEPVRVEPGLGNESEAPRPVASQKAPRRSLFRRAILGRRTLQEKASSKQGAGLGVKRARSQLAARLKGMSSAAGASGQVAAKLTETDVLVVTDQGEQKAWWSLDLVADTVTEVASSVPPEDYEGEHDPAPRAEPVLSFSIHDLTAPIKRNEMKGQITARFEREEGLKVEIVARSKGDTLAFGAEGEWIKTYAPQRLFPGTYALSALLKERAPKRLPAIAGFMFQQSSAPLLVLYEVKDNAQIGNMAFVPRAGGKQEMELALRSFAEEKGISLFEDWTSQQLVLFTSADLRQVLPSIRAYPTEPYIGNVPVRQLWSGALLVSACALAGAIANDVYQIAALHSEQSTLALKREQVEQIDHELKSTVTANFARFVELANIDPTPTLQKAQAVYVSGAKVDVTLNRAVPLQLVVTAPSQSKAALNFRDAPPGCQRAPLSTNSNVNVIQATYECAPHSFDFAGLFGPGHSLRSPGE